MKTRILTTAAGPVVKISLDLVSYDRAVRRAEKKLGATLSFAGGDGSLNVLLADGSPASTLHHRRAAARRESTIRHTERCRLIQSAAAKALKAKLATVMEVKGLGAFEAFNACPKRPAGAGKLRNLAAGYFTVIPATTPQLP